MTGRDYLRRLVTLRKLIEKCRKDIEYWRILAENISGNPVGPHYNPNRSENAPYEYCIQKETELQKLLGNLTVERDAVTLEILRRLERMPNIREREVLCYRYVKGCSWDYIRRTMHISESTVYRIHRDALKKI